MLATFGLGFLAGGGGEPMGGTPDELVFLSLSLFALGIFTCFSMSSDTLTYPSCVVCFRFLPATFGGAGFSGGLVLAWFGVRVEVGLDDGL